MTEPAPSEVLIAAALANSEVVEFKGGETMMQECPIQPLGMSNGVYFFTSPEGELRNLAARDFTDRQLISLFAGDLSWMVQNFPSYDKEGNPSGDFKVKKVTAALMRACHMRGIFSTETPLRGHGVWRFGEKVVVHTGDGIYYDRAWFAPGKIIGHAIYIARAKVDRPDFDQPLDDFQTRQIRQWFNAWAFRENGDADLLFGFLGAALLGGFPSWRVHALVVGERGTGKSSLGEFIADCLGAQGTQMNNYTEAGLRQRLQNEARAIWLDEGETGHDQSARRMADVIRLLRLLSSGEGARIVRGSSGGQAQSSTVTGCVMITAINPPHLEPQDRSRIIEINLNKPEQRETTEKDLEYFKTEARARSNGLRARAVSRAGHFAAAFSLFRRTLVIHGCDGRQADLFATLLSGRSTLLDSGMPTQEDATALVATYKERLSVIFIEDREASDGQICLNQLYDFILDNYRNEKRISIGQQLMACIADNAEDMALQAFGMKVMRCEDGYKKLFIPNDHVQLKRIFANSVWGNGGWNKSLQRLPGVKSTPDPVRVAGSKRRGVYVPHDLLPKAGTDTDRAPMRDDHPDPPTPP